MSRRQVVPYACVAAAVVVANLPALLHLITVDPLYLDSGLVSRLPEVLRGYPTIDPNAGYLMQALGHLTSADWLSGHVPWWNPYEGIGVPLAGDMQSGAFYLPTLLFHFSNGLLYLQLLLELVAGWSTVALLGRLGVGRTLATAGGVAFGLCGTFAWFAIEPIRVLAFLPLCLLGVERALAAAQEGRAWGWRLLAVAVAFSVYGGFPETIFLDLLFVAWWAVLRVAGPGRRAWRRMVGKLSAGAVAGVALSAPLWVAFAGYARFANTGAHGNGAYAYVVLHGRDLAQLVLPYSLGPIFGFHSVGPVDAISVFWSNVGGYLDVTLVAGAVVGLVGRHNRILRVGLGLWVAVCLTRTYGLAPAVHLLALVPVVRLTAFYRYADPTWELAVVVLAAVGFDDVARRRTGIRALWIGVGVAAAGAVAAALAAWRSLTTAAGPTGGMETHRHLFVAGSVAFALVMLALVAIGGWLAAGRRPPAHGRAARRQGPGPARLRRWGRIVLAGAVAVEAVVLLGVTYLSAPRPTAVATGSVSWLQANLDTYRFATLGPIQPNYGSYFGLAEVNVNELPLPRAWTNYVEKDLDTNTVPFEFTGGNESNPAGPSPAEELSTLMANYEAVGVRYVVAPASSAAPGPGEYPVPGSPQWPRGPRLVYQDSTARIWELPDPAPAFSVASAPAGTAAEGGPPGSSCRVAVHGWDEAQVTCDHPTVLLRRVQYAPGWTATVGSRSVPVVRARSGPPGLFQEVPVPAGTTTVRFTYLPPHEVPAVLVAVVTALGLLATLFVASGRRRRGERRAQKSEPPSSTGPEPAGAPRRSAVGGGQVLGELDER
ncbi:MAG: hypothetical protein ACLQPH_03390 [Acidimicrobiales bacterium]